MHDALLENSHIFLYNLYENVYPVARNLLYGCIGERKL